VRRVERVAELERLFPLFTDAACAVAQVLTIAMNAALSPRRE
jgi:hypothetical protein